MSNPFATAGPAFAPTESQINYLRDLTVKKSRIEGKDLNEAVAEFDTWVASLSRSEVSDEIDNAKEWLAENTPRTASPFSSELEDGFYELDGVDTPIRVIHAIHGSGHQYARALNSDTRKWDVQLPGLLSRVATEGVRIDTDPARAPELGKLYGICMVCGTTLTDKEPGGSIELGIGPVCRSRRGW